MTLVAAADPFLIAADLFDPPERTVSPLERDWRTWLLSLLGTHFWGDFAPHHEQFWQWLWSLRPGVRPEAFVGCWARGGGKSSSAEAACVAIGALGKRRYGWYMSSIADQANDHVGNVQSMLESSGVEREYPEMASRLVTQYGHSKGWKQNRLRTASGFTLDAMGLDKMVRGSKMDASRPDFIVLDDLDSEDDSPAAVEKKITKITHKVLPAGSRDLAVLAIQNVVHERSIFARLAGVATEDLKADFLARRIVSGPVPAVEGLDYEADPDRADGGYRITAGTATWSGQDLATCQAQMDDWGLSAFLSEAQHAVEPPAGGTFSHLDYRHCDWSELPELVRVVVWVDPAVTDKDQSDSQGIQADGLAEDGTIYRLWSWEQRTSPLDAMKRAIAKALELGAEAVGVETDQGGDTWESVYREALDAVLGDMTPADRFDVRVVPQFREDKAGAGHGPKTHRAALMLAEYERNRFVHVRGTHDTLERGLRRFPRTKPYDLVDAAYWAMADLLGPVLGESEMKHTGLRGRR